MPFLWGAALAVRSAVTGPEQRPATRVPGAGSYTGLMAHDDHGRSTVRVLGLSLAVTLTFAVVEVAVGFFSGSLALISDAGHMLVDSASLVLALAAAAVSRRPSDLRRTYGYARAEVLAVPLQVGLMLGLAGYIVSESISRIGSEPEISALPVFITGSAGLALNVVVLRLLATHSHQNMGARAARLEVAFDALGSVGVLVAGAVLFVWGWTPIDIIVSLAVGALVVPRAISLLRQAVAILLEGVPPGVNTDEIVASATAIEGVNALHDLHVWSLAPSFLALSAHVEVDSMTGSERAIASLASVLKERHGIGHVTLQAETHELHEAMACCEFPDALADPGHRAHAPAVAVPEAHAANHR